MKPQKVSCFFFSITVKWCFSVTEKSQNATNDVMILCIYQCNLSLTRLSTEMETGEGDSKHAFGNQIIAGKFVLGTGFCCPCESSGVEGGWE